MPWRLSLKLHRFELAAYATLSIGVAIVATVAAAVLSSVPLTNACLHLFDGGGYTASEIRGCEGADAFSAINGSWAGWIVASMAVLPLLGGAVLGSQLVSRDVDDQTAQWAWSLGLSRKRWLWQRAVPLLVALALLTAIPALASWLLEATRNPSVDPGATFLDYGLRGPVVVWRAIAAFAVSLLIGAAIGRSLPALLLSLGVMALGFFLLVATMAWGHALTAVPARSASDNTGYLLVSSGWLAGDGTILSEEVARAGSPVPGDPEVTIAWLIDHYDEVSLIIPGSRLPAVEGREIAAVAAVTLASLAATVLVVNRRRPY